MKILYVTTVSVTMNFFPAHIRMLLDAGHTVELACNCEQPVNPVYAEWGCRVHHIPFSRSPFSRDNLAAYRALRRLLMDGGYDIVHTHTPNASAMVRLACRDLRKKGTRVFYTAHGFHFFRGGPRKNWLLYYPVEKLCARWTDVLITINTEDYALARRKMKAGQVVYIPGVGLDLEKYSCPDTRAAKRQEFGIPADAYVLLTVGELNANKNQATVIRALAGLHDPSVHYVLAGRGENEGVLRRLAGELGVAEQVHLLGYRTDVPEIYPAADVYLCPSFREGLNVSIMEAMSSGLPLLCSDIRGNRDLVSVPEGGLLVPPGDPAAWQKAICDLRGRGICISNQNRVREFGQQIVIDRLTEIYRVIE